MKNRKQIRVLLALPILVIFTNIDITAQEVPAVVPRVRYVSSVPSSEVPRRTITLEKSEVVVSDETLLMEKEAFDLINLQRLERGLTELKWNQKLSELARQHSENMATNGFFSHFGLNGGLVDSRAMEADYSSWKAIGENIAYNKGFENPTSFAVERWMISDGHRKNLLDARWKESGLGVAITKDGKYFFTQIFVTMN